MMMISREACSRGGVFCIGCNCTGVVDTPTGVGAWVALGATGESGEEVIGPEFGFSEVAMGVLEGRRKCWRACGEGSTRFHTGVIRRRIVDLFMRNRKSIA